MIIKDYDPKDIDMKMLYEDTSWGAIELNYNLDVEKLTQYYADVKKNFNHMYFDFYNFPDRLNVEVSKQYMDLGYCGYYCGPISGYTLAWPVEKYEPLLEVVTDKVNMEVPSPYNGVLTAILVDEGAVVPMGTPIAEMDAEGVDGGEVSNQPEIKEETTEISPPASSAGVFLKEKLTFTLKT